MKTAVIEKIKDNDKIIIEMYNEILNNIISSNKNKIIYQM